VPQKSFIAGISGPILTEAERAFFRREQPCGCILFRRNVQTPDQVRALIAGIRDATGAERFFVAIDQEGGRVQRLGPPHWRRYPPAAAFPALDRIAAPGSGLRAARLAARLIAADLHELGINVDCAPVLDIPTAGADGVIGDRAYGTAPELVAAYGRAFAEGLLDGGVLPVIKHIPGHGRAPSDSHFHLPVIDCGLNDLQATDFAPFVRLADMPMAMTAHVILSALDPGRAVTISEPAIAQAIRGAIGFNGLLLSDDLSMRALDGGLESRARAALAAGCDIALHCNGILSEMEAVASACGPIEGASLARFDAAFARLHPPHAFDREQALAALDEMLAAAA
jgi:beta-N-acetylhexosaminidase